MCGLCFYSVLGKVEPDDRFVRVVNTYDRPTTHRYASPIIGLRVGEKLGTSGCAGLIIRAIAYEDARPCGGPATFKCWRGFSTAACSEY